jgi:hypothetical protein
MLIQKEELQSLESVTFFSNGATLDEKTKAWNQTSVLTEGAKANVRYVDTLKTLQEEDLAGTLLQWVSEVFEIRYASPSMLAISSELHNIPKEAFGRFTSSHKLALSMLFFQARMHTCTQLIPNP